ncbi:MAG: YcdB/YcdC domain-containing protein [Candidatus Hodarchaeota archaeon]
MQQDELMNLAERFILNREKIETKPNQITSECDQGYFIRDSDGQPQRYRTKVKVNQFFTEINVRLDADTGQLVSWLVDGRYEGATETTLDEEQAKQLASEKVEIPDDAEIEEVVQVQEPDSHITSIIWGHVVNGLEVENDCIAVQINSKTQEIISLSKIWHSVTDHVDKISIKNAEEIATREAPQHIAGENFDIQLIEQKFIPVIFKESDNKLTTRIVKVWMVTIKDPAFRFRKIFTLSINCITGEIVRVEHNR